MSIAMQTRILTQGSLGAAVPADNNMADSAVPIAAGIAVAEHLGAHSVRWASVLEASFVLFALLMIAALSGGQWRDWLGAAAVFLTFLHAQLAFDFEDSQQGIPKPAVQNFRWAGRLFVTKEVMWVLTFFMTGSWPLCLGSVIFATYPHWRKLMRRQLLRTEVSKTTLAGI